MFTAIKLFFGGLPLANIKNYALVGLIIYSVFITLLLNLEKMSHKLTTQEYESFKAQTQVQSAFRLEQNARKEAEAKKNADKAEEEHNKQLASLFVDGQKQRDKLKSELDSYYAKDKLNRFRLGAYADRLQLDASSDSATRSETSSEAEYPQTTSECDGISAYARTLERACAVTTSDFNLCSQWVEDVCDVFGCGK